MGKGETVFFCGHLWEQGKREKNEDSLAFWYMKKGRKHRIMAIICDGIGGLKEGEQASSYVVRQITNWFMAEGYQKEINKKLEPMLQQLCYQIHEELKNYGKDKGIRLGSTMTLFLADARRYLWIHCGDCRLYLFRKDKIKLLTKDDCEKNGAVNKAIGAGEWQLLTKNTGRMKNGDTFLLCTDGFYGKVDSELLCSFLKKKFRQDEDVKRMLRQMYQKKAAMGEKDNISAICLQVGRKRGN